VVKGGKLMEKYQSSENSQFHLYVNQPPLRLVRQGMVAYREFRNAA
jgi:hypothetical protein